MEIPFFSFLIFAIIGVKLTSWIISYRGETKGYIPYRLHVKGSTNTWPKPKRNKWYLNVHLAGNLLHSLAFKTIFNFAFYFSFHEDVIHVGKSWTKLSDVDLLTTSLIASTKFSTSKFFKNFFLLY